VTEGDITVGERGKLLNSKQRGEVEMTPIRGNNTLKIFLRMLSRNS
jgi:hypothetical protein